GEGPAKPAPAAPGAADANPDRGAVVRGRVIDPDGHPVAGAKLYLIAAGATEVPTPQATADADGRFRLTLPSRTAGVTPVARPIGPFHKATAFVSPQPA